MDYRGKRKGAVLIVVLGVLCILALLATTFATLQMTERQIASNYLNMVRAKLLAMSGVEDATARLKDYFPFRAFDPSPAAAKAWIYYGAEKDRYNNVPIPALIEKAVNPSFPYENEAVQDPTLPNLPQNLTIEGQPRGFSGVMGSGKYGQYTEHYALKASDLAGHLYVNDGIEGGATGSVSQNLKRILNILGQIKPSVDVPNLGDKILAGRPATGYRHIDQLLSALGYDEAAFKRVREFVTVSAWVDPNVANPVPLSAATASQYPVNYFRGSPPIYRFGSSKDAAGAEIVPATGLQFMPLVPATDPSIRIYGLDTLNPQWIEIVSRAPVNVNSAPREVLTALLADLKGFFVSDRRRNNPNGKGTAYAFTNQSSYSPAPGVAFRPDWASPDTYDDGDEYGFLAQTKQILAPPAGSRVAGEIYADIVADHVIACREQKIFGGFDYGTVVWGGPFRNWNQFNAFVDHLVTLGVFQDDRPLWFDHDPNGTDTSGNPEPTGYGPLVASSQQRNFAARAIADVVKANFNPNLHLNELNPDANLHAIVDKTDLIVNSTEFTFLSTGYFEIESLGRVVRPKGGIADARLGDNELMASAKITAVVKLFDLYRETNQKQFYGGTFGPNAGVDTSNGRALEVGPEPDNGKAPGENEWGGYVALSTVGGPFGGSHGAAPKAPDTLVTTLSLADQAHFNSAFHVHFGLDFDAHHHLFDRREIAGRKPPQTTDDAVDNYPDRVGGADLSYGGPYAPTNGPDAGASDYGPSGIDAPLVKSDHRLAKCFRRKTASGTTTNPMLTPFAPSDLRVDGGYSERHAAPAYFTSAGKGRIWDFDKDNASGMVSFWFKPSFFPELTGKVRSVWDFSRYHESCPRGVHVWPFAMWFFPTHYNGSENNDPFYTPESLSKFQSTSLVWGNVQYHDRFDNWMNPFGPSPRASTFGNATFCLNHEGHNDNKPSVLRGHRWINATFTWDLRGDYSMDGSRLYVNGASTLAPYDVANMNIWSTVCADKIHWWDKHDGPNGVEGAGEYNQMRLGGPSRICTNAIVKTQPAVTGAYRGNYSADFTLDEFYVWKNPADAGALGPQLLWVRGRYGKPDPGQGIFTSRPFSLTSNGHRLLAPASNIAPPGGAPPPSASVPADPLTVRVLGVAWTWYGEPLDPGVTPLNTWDGKPVLYDYSNSLSVVNVQPDVSLAVKDGTLVYPAAGGDGFAAVKANDGSIPVIQAPDQLQYQARFDLKNSGPGTILLATPVLDDVTIYWDEGRATVISYIYDNRSF